MSTPWILHRLYSLDTSSPDFLRSPYSLFRHDEEERHLTNLRGTGLAGRFSRRGMYPPFRLSSAYETESTGSRCHFHQPRCLSTMSPQTSSNLWSSPGAKPTSEPEPEPTPIQETTSLPPTTDPASPLSSKGFVAFAPTQPSREPSLPDDDGKDNRPIA